MLDLQGLLNTLGALPEGEAPGGESPTAERVEQWRLTLAAAETAVSSQDEPSTPLPPDGGEPGDEALPEPSTGSREAEVTPADLAPALGTLPVIEVPVPGVKQPGLEAEPAVVDRPLDAIVQASSRAAVAQRLPSDDLTLERLHADRTAQRAERIRQAFESASESGAVRRRPVAAETGVAKEAADPLPSREGAPDGKVVGGRPPQPATNGPTLGTPLPRSVAEGVSDAELAIRVQTATRADGPGVTRTDAETPVKIEPIVDGRPLAVLEADSPQSTAGTTPRIAATQQVGAMRPDAAPVEGLRPTLSTPPAAETQATIQRTPPPDPAPRPAEDLLRTAAGATVDTTSEPNERQAAELRTVAARGVAPARPEAAAGPAAPVSSTARIDGEPIAPTVEIVRNETRVTATHDEETGLPAQTSRREPLDVAPVERRDAPRANVTEVKPAASGRSAPEPDATARPSADPGGSSPRESPDDGGANQSSLHHRHEPKTRASFEQTAVGRTREVDHETPEQSVEQAAEEPEIADEMIHARRRAADTRPGSHTEAALPRSTGRIHASGGETQIETSGLQHSASSTTSSSARAEVGSTGSAPTRVHHQALAESILARARAVPRNGTVELRFALEPEDLGPVRVRIESRGDELRIRIVAASGNAVELLGSGVPRLSAQLTDAGIQTAEIDLSFDDSLNTGSRQRREGSETSPHGPRTPRSMQDATQTNRATQGYAHRYDGRLDRTA